MKRLIGFSILCFLMLAIVSTGWTYEAMMGPTGVLHYDQKKAFDGYTLLAPNSCKKTYLIDMEGNVVHTWKSRYTPGLYAQLLPNGNLLRGGRPGHKYCGISGVGGLVQEIDWDGKVVWEYEMSTKDEVQHHAFHRMENGNTMILGWERVENETMIAKGRKPNTIPKKSVKSKGIKHRDFWLDFVREVNPAGETVWEWHVIDHVGTGPDQLDPNFILPRPVGKIYHTFDWSHFNAVDFIEETNQVLMCSRNLSEVYLVDYKTGKITWRWGNPTAHGQGKAPSWYDSGDQILFGPHDARYIGDGQISIFDNGSERPEGHRSRIVVVDIETRKIVWQYRAWDTASFSSHRQGAAQLLPNGNYFVTSSNKGHVFEVTEKGKIVWDFVNPLISDKSFCLIRDDDKKNVQIQGHDYYFNMVHRAYRYGKDYPGLQGKKLENQGKLAEDCPEFYKLYE